MRNQSLNCLKKPFYPHFPPGWKQSISLCQWIWESLPPCSAPSVQGACTLWHPVLAVLGLPPCPAHGGDPITLVLVPWLLLLSRWLGSTCET